MSEMSPGSSKKILRIKNLSFPTVPSLLFNFSEFFRYKIVVIIISKIGMHINFIIALLILSVRIFK
jgi:hypothetical protein